MAAMSNWRIEMYDAVQDNILERMVPSDLRLLIGERDRAEAEAQALREQLEVTCREKIKLLDANAQMAEQVAALRARVVVVPEPLNEGDARRECGEYGVAMQRGYSACLRELARLNGKAVSEGLLRRLYQGWCKAKDTADLADSMEELRALLGDGKEAAS